MIKILANDGIEADGKLLLEDAGFEVTTEKVAQADLPKELPAYDVVIVRSATKIRKELIDICPNLKIIARGGVGLDNIDVDYAKSKGIKVINTPAASSRSVAELALGHMLALSRSLHLSNREMPVKGDTEFKTLKSNYGGGIELKGKTLGIIGFGRIGQETAKIALGLGMKVLPVDLYVDEATISIELFEIDQASISVKLNTVSMDKMIAESDYITVHVPAIGDKALLGAEEIRKMKDGVILVNTARGGIIDEEALLDAANSGKVGGAALDVFLNEPTPNRALLNHPRISVSPHIGAATQEAQSNIGKELADQIIAHFHN
ncbi:MAG: D-2-hydroxyacid dehydrogenase [Saprospiraceae bacterium]|nr:D-2-hydroxyacid dehydrogenase [Saprospiraceae bacterium]